MTTEQTRIGAVLLAGGDVPAGLASLCRYRALLQLRGRYLLDYILETVRSTSGVAAAAAVVPEATLPDLDHLPTLKVAAGNSIVENMQRGARALADQRLTHLLFITGDIPLVTPEGLQAYLTASLESGAALTYPIIPRAASEQRFPGAKRTYVRLREGTFTGGNLIFTQANLLDARHALIQEIYAARKHPVKLAGILGWATVGKMLAGSLTLPYLEGVASRILDAPTRAIITPYPEIGFDVDKAEDLQAVERALAGS